VKGEIALVLHRKGLSVKEGTIKLKMPSGASRPSMRRSIRGRQTTTYEAKPSAFSTATKKKYPKASIFVHRAKKGRRHEGGEGRLPQSLKRESSPAPEAVSKP